MFLFSQEKDVCPSVHLSVCLSVKLVICDKMKKSCAHILIPHGRSFILVFRLVPTLVTLNDLEQRRSTYFALFHQI